MEREGDIIKFDPLDRSRYSNLPEWVPVDGVPAIYDTLTEQQEKADRELDEAQGLDVMEVPEHIRLHKIGAATSRLADFSLLKKQLGKLAPDEIAASIPLEETLPDFDITVLHQK